MNVRHRIRRLAHEIEGGETMTAGQVFALLGAVTAIIRRHVTDRETQRAIAADILRLSPTAIDRAMSATPSGQRGAGPDADDEGRR